MKKNIIISAFIASAFCLSASIPDELTEDFGQTEISASDPEYEWSQIDTKQIKVGFKSQSLQFESKQMNGFAYSVVELPIDPENNTDFLFGVNLTSYKVSGTNDKIANQLVSKSNNPNGSSIYHLIKGSFGLIFDYQDIHNYKAIAISQKEYQYYVMKDGTYSMIKSGPVKYTGDSFKLLMKRENGGAEFILNGIEVCKLRKLALTSSYFGVFINGKGKAEMPSFIFYVPAQEETEQSTSTT